MPAEVRPSVPEEGAHSRKLGLAFLLSDLFGKVKMDPSHLAVNNCKLLLYTPEGMFCLLNCFP